MGKWYFTIRKNKFDKLLISKLKAIKKEKRLHFYFCEYDYGEMVLDNGTLNFNDDIDDVIRKDLSYNAGSNPAGIILDGCLELFYEQDGSIIPYREHT